MKRKKIILSIFSLFVILNFSFFIAKSNSTEPKNDKLTTNNQATENCGKKTSDKLFEPQNISKVKKQKINFGGKEYTSTTIISLLDYKNIIEQTEINKASAAGCSATATTRNAKQLSQKIIESDGILTAWKTILALSNSAFVMFLIFTAFANILRFNIDTYAIKKVLPSLVLGVVLANLSLVLCRVILEASSVMTNWIVTTWSNIPGNNLLLEIYDALGMGAITGGDIGSLASGGTATLGIIIAIAGGCGAGCGILIFIFALTTMPIAFFWVLIFVFYIRYFVVIGLVIVAPIACFSMGFPMTEKYFQQWWNMFVKWSFMPAITFFIIRIGVIVSQALDTETAGSGLDLMKYMILLGACFFGAKIPLTMGGGIMGSWTGLLKKSSGWAAGWGAKGYGSLWAKGANKFKGSNDKKLFTVPYSKLNGKLSKIPFVGKKINLKDRDVSVGNFFRGTNAYGAKKAWQMRQDQNESNRWQGAKQADLQRRLMGRQARQKADMDDMRSVFSEEYAADKLYDAATSKLTPEQRKTLWKTSYSEIWNKPELQDADTGDVATAYFAMKQLRRIASTGRGDFGEDAKKKFNNLFPPDSDTALPVDMNMTASAANTGSNNENDYDKMAFVLASELTAHEENVIKSVLGDNADPQEIMHNLENGANASQIKIDGKSLEPAAAEKLNSLAQDRVSRKAQTTSDIATEGADNATIKGIMGNVDVTQVLNDIDQGADVSAITQKYGVDATPHWGTIQGVATRRRAKQNQLLNDYTDNMFTKNMQLPAEEALTVATEMKINNKGAVSEETLTDLQGKLQSHLSTLNVKTTIEADEQRFQEVKAEIGKLSPTLSIAATNKDSLKKGIENVVKGLDTLKSDDVYKAFQTEKLDTKNIGQIRSLQKQNFQKQFKQDFSTNKIGQIAEQHVAGSGGNLAGIEDKIAPQIDRMIETFEGLNTQISQHVSSIPNLRQDVVKGVAREVAGKIQVEAGPNVNNAETMKNLFMDPKFRKNFSRIVGSATNNVLGQKLNSLGNTPAKESNVPSQHPTPTPIDRPASTPSAAPEAPQVTPESSTPSAPKNTNIPEQTPINPTESNNS